MGALHVNDPARPQIKQLGHNGGGPHINGHSVIPGCGIQRFYLLDAITVFVLYHSSGHLPVMIAETI